MAKAWDDFWFRKQREVAGPLSAAVPATSGRPPAPAGHTWVRFTADCIHRHLPYQAGDEIIVEDHWADSIEAIGSGHRITD